MESIQSQFIKNISLREIMRMALGVSNNEPEMVGGALKKDDSADENDDDETRSLKEEDFLPQNIKEESAAEKPKRKNVPKKKKTGGAKKKTAVKRKHYLRKTSKKSRYVDRKGKGGCGQNNRGRPSTRHSKRVYKKRKTESLQTKFF